VETYSPAHAGQALTLAALDEAFAAWIASSPTDVDLINGTINAIGMAFGSTLIEGLGLKWVIATDDQGSDLAVYGYPGQGDVLIYPANFVAKRWQRREVNFLEESYRQLEGDITKLRDSHASKHFWKF